MSAGQWNGAGETESRRPERPVRRRRRLLRVSAVITIGWLMVAGWAPAASAMTLRWPSLSLSGLGAWLAGSPALRVPVQHGGTAAGRPHYVPASATMAHRGAGRRPGRGPGQLPPYHPFSPPAHRFLTKALPGAGYSPTASRFMATGSTATSSLYRNTDGSYTRMVYPGPVNYRTASGAYHPINTALVAAGRRWQETANSVAVSAAPVASGRAVGLVGFGARESLGFGLAGAAPVAGTAVGPVITYPGALPGTNLSQAATADGIGASLVLHSAGAASTWLLPLRLRGLTALPASGGVITLRNAAGTAVAEVTPPAASDARLSAAPGAVTGQVVAYQGGQALRVSLDRAWLTAAARVFPVTVSVGVRALAETGGATGSTYVDSGFRGDNSGAPFLRVGQYRDASGVLHEDRAFLHVSDVASGLRGYQVTAASLHLFNTWSATCAAPESFAVHQVTSRWLASDPLAWPGPTLGPEMGSLNVPASSAACGNTSGSQTRGVWTTVPLTPGLPVLNAWARHPDTDMGLAVTAGPGPAGYKQFDGASAAPGSQPYLELTISNSSLPQIDSQYPPNNYSAPSLRPELIASGSGGSGSLQYDFTIDDSSGNKVVSSGLGSSHWRVPSEALAWNQTYYWFVQAKDGAGNYSTVQKINALATPVPQPTVTSGLSQNAGGQGFDPANSDYTTSATDAQVSVTGPALAIERYYNSEDPRTTGAFGAGWSSVLDAQVSPGLTDLDGSVQTEVVTYPDGEQVGFGVAPDGKFTAPQGRFATLASLSGGGYTLTDKNDTVYTFGQSLGSGTYGISSITDAIGHALSFTWASGQITQISSAVSNRSLSLTWSGGLVASVTTDPVTTGNQSTALTWTYGYSGSKLKTVCAPGTTTACTTVCPPGTTTVCTAYTYKAGTDYPATVMDTGPHSFWPLDEASGTTAASTVLVNEGADNGTYSNVTLGQPALLAGSTQTTASFNGTSSAVTLPGEELESGATYQSISVWFKTSLPTGSAAGVIYANSVDPITDSSTTNDFTPELYVGSNGYLYGEYWNGDPTPIKASSARVNDGNWHQAVLTSYNTSSGDGQALYLDGNLAGTMSGTVSNTSLDNDYLGTGFIGQNWPEEPNKGGNAKPVYFNGQLADAGFWDRSLNSGEISAMYQAGINTNSLLTQVTRPSGSVYAKVGYDPGTGAVTSVTDDNGGTWQVGAPTDTGSSQVYVSAVLGQHPADYWRLGETGTTTAVNQVSGGTAAYSSVTQGVTGGPFSDTTVDSFDGSTSYISLPQGLVNSTGNQSVSLWFKTSKAHGVLFGYAQNPITSSTAPANFTPALYIGSDGFLYGEFWNGSSSPMKSTSEVDDNEWHNAVLATETDGQTLYLDGKKMGTMGGTVSQPGPQPYVYAGAGFNNNSWTSGPSGSTAQPDHFSGLMGDVSFYNSELSAAQVSAEYSALEFSDGLTPVQTVHVTDPAGKTLTYSMDPLNGNRLIAQTDALGNTTRYGYDTGGFLYNTVDPDGIETITGHDVRGNQVSQTTCQNQAQNLCSTSYDAYYPNDTSTSPSPDPRNDLPETEAGPGSATATDNTFLTSYAYNSQGQLTSVTTPPVAGFPQGRTTITTYTDGTSSFPAFDNPSKNAPAGLPATETSPGGAVTTAKYDLNGDLAEVINPDGLTTKYIYDGLGRLASQTVISDSYPSGLKTTYGYNSVGELTTETSPSVLDRVTGDLHTAKTTTIYDADGDVTSETVADTVAGGDASRTVTNTYNSHDQLVTSADPAGATTQYGYDAYGNLASETNPAGDVKQYLYDPNGHLLTVTLENYTGNPANPQSPAPLVESSRAYDPAGRLASVTDSMGDKTTYAYYDDGLLYAATRSDPAGASSFTEQSDTYNPAEQLTKQVTNNGATTTAYTPDAAGRNTSVTVDPAGLDRTTTYAYAPDDQVVNQTLTGPGSTTPVQSTSYTYDPMGNMTSQSQYLKGGGDPLGWWRLDQAPGSGTAVPDASGVGNNATATNVTWGGNAGAFDGSSSFVATKGPVLDTTGSFSVSAWAKLAGNTGADQGVVSQPASNQDGFRIQYSAVSNPPTWAFDRTTTSSGSTKVYAQGTAAVSTSKWYHLVGTYDATTGAMTFYVNGAQVGTNTDTTPFAASGPLTIGRDEWNGTNSNYFDGSISDVQVYQRVLSPAEIAALYNAGRDGGANPSNRLTTTWALDQRGLPTSMTDPNGNTTNYTYDEAGRLAVTAAPAVSVQLHGQPVTQTVPVTTTGYNTFGERVETKDPNGNVTTTAYDADGRPVSVAQPPYTPPGSQTPINAVTTAAYNNLGEMTSRTSPNNGQTTYKYDQLGDTAIVTAPDGGVSTYTYDTNGDQLTATGPTNAVTTATYDYLGRLATSTEEETHGATAAYTTNYSYGFGGWLSSQTLPPTQAVPGGITTSYTYDAAGEKTGVTDGVGNTTSYGYDPAGELTTTTYANGSASTDNYDAVGRVIGQADLSTTGTVLRSERSAYDPNGNLVGATDYNGNTTTFTYDAGNRLSAETQPVTATSGITTSFGYDAAGNRTLYVDGNGNNWWTTYNPWNLPELQIEPDTAAHSGTSADTFTTSYDADGNPVTLNEPGGVSITNTYNNMDQLTGQSGAGTAIATTSRTFGYDLAGNLTTAATTAAGSAPATSETFTYNDRGLPLTASGTAGSTTYAYNADDQVKSVADAAGTTAYTYDAAGRLATLADPLTGTTATYSYNKNAQVSSISNGTGNDVRTLSYNGLRRLSADKLTTSGGQAVASISYGYDPNGNLTSKTTTGFGGSAAISNTYTYDEANRLTSWNNGTATVNYGYDGAGNRTQVGNQTLTYDARDELLSAQAGSGPATTYAYSARGTLTSVTSSSGTTNYNSDAYGEAVAQGPQSFTYDGLGRAVSDTGTGGSFSLSYAGVSRQIAADGAWNYSYDPYGNLDGIGPAGGTTAQGVLAYTDLHTDLVGTFAPSGAALAGSAAYSPLGAVTAASGLAGNLGYQSGFTDPASAEVNMGARWYAPGTGQFTTRDTAIVDPVPDSAAANPFAYAGDNPMLTTDPSGHMLVDPGGGGGHNTPPPAPRPQPRPAPPPPAGCPWWDLACHAVNIYHHYVVPFVHHVVHVVVVTMQQGLRNVTGLLARGLALAGHLTRDALTGIADAARQGAHAVSSGWHAAVSAGASAVHSVARWAVTTYHQAAHVVHTAWHAVAKAANTVATFIKNHAATIASFAVSAAVFVGCDAALGVATGGVGAVAGAVACGALAGAAGNAVSYGITAAQTGNFSLTGLASSIGTGALVGAAGGLVGGLATAGLYAVGDAATSLLADGAQSVSADAAANAAATGADDAAAVATNDAASGAASDAATSGGIDAASSGDTSLANAPDEAGLGTRAPASCGGASFTPGTKVLLASGAAVPIASLRRGQKVLATSTRTGKTTAKAVAVVLVHHDTNRYNLKVSTGHGSAVIHTTRTHLFWAPTAHRWIKAATLPYGTHLATPGGATATVLGGHNARTRTGWMWDLTIPTDHDFYIAVGSAAVLVHNCADGGQGSLFDEGPYRTGSGKTSGVLRVGGDSIPLESRAANLQNYPASGHVEGQAALIMRERGATSGILEIDNPNGICPRCVQQVPTLLPEGAELEVRTPLGTVPKRFWSNGRTFIGNSQDPLPWPR